MPSPNESGDAFLAPGVVAVSDPRALERCCVRLVPVSSGGGSVDPPQRGFDYRSASPGVSATGSDSSSSAALAGGPADSGVAGSKDDVEEGEVLANVFIIIIIYE